MLSKLRFGWFGFVVVGVVELGWAGPGRVELICWVGLLGRVCGSSCWVWLLCCVVGFCCWVCFLGWGVGPGRRVGALGCVDSFGRFAWLMGSAVVLGCFIVLLGWRLLDRAGVGLVVSFLVAFYRVVFGCVVVLVLV